MQRRFKDFRLFPSNPCSRLYRLKPWFACTTAIAALICYADVATPYTFPSTTGLRFQTSGPSRCANIGDWYTTNGVDPCSPTSSSPTTSTDKIHRFLVDITQAMLTEQGGSITVTINDAESNGALDEVDGTLDKLTSTTSDPTRFRLISPTGSVLSTQVVPTSSANGTTLTFTINQPGTYQITSETGAKPINGDSTSTLNDDDNTFTITVPDPVNAQNRIIIGQRQGSVQQNTGAAITANLYFLVGPGTNSLYLRNFDLDKGGTVSYVRPSGATIAGTASDNAVWNGNGTQQLNSGGDTITGLSTLSAATSGDAGIWGYTIAAYTNSNQSVFEANTGDGTRLAILDTPPTRAGNFTITPNSTLVTGIGVPVDHTFTVTNNFFTNDISNLTTSGTNANYTVQLLDASGNALTDTDGDGTFDTGVLTPGQAKNFILRVTPKSGATTADTTRINAISFMDKKVDAANNTTLFVDKTTGVVAGYKSVKLTTDADSSTTVTAGDTVTWTFSYANTNGADITNFQITDALPTGVTIAGTPTITANTTQGTAPGANTSYNGTGNNNLLSATTTLKAGGVITVNIPVKINSGTTGAKTNQASASGTSLPTAGIKTDNVDSTTTGLPTGVTVPSGSIAQTQNANTIDPTSISITTAPNVSGYKSVKLTTDADNSTTLTPGDTVTWTLSYTNTGSADGTNFQIADTLPTGVILAGTPTVTANTTQGIAPTVNTSYNGTSNTNLFLLSAASILKVGGVITVNIPVKINSGVTGILSNQATASGTNLPTAGVKTDNVDNSTTGLPTGVTIPAGSINQTQVANIDPTTVNVVAPSRFCRGSDIPLLSFQNPKVESGTDKQVGAVYRFSNVTSGVDALVKIDSLNNGATLNAIDGQGTTGGVGSADAFQPELIANVSNATDSSIDFTITFVKAGTSTAVTLSSLHASGVDIDGNGDTAKPLREYIELSDFSRYTIDNPTNLKATITSLAPMRGRFESKDTTNQPGITLNATQNIATGEYTNVSTFKYRVGAFNVIGATANNRLASLYFDCVAYSSPVTTTPTPPIIDLDGDNSSGATGNNYQKTFIVGGAAVSAADTDVKITDEKNFIDSATITLTNRPNGTSENLSIDITAGGTVSGVTASAYDPATGKITLTTNTPDTITLAQYQAIIATVKYNNTAASPNTTNRTINVQVADNDGLASNTAVSTISFATRANLLLVKRITAINTTAITAIVDDPSDPNDTNANWPGGYIKGTISQNNIQPGDVVEYTIYFLSNGGSDAVNSSFCDLVPTNTTFAADGFAIGKGIRSSLGTTTTDLTNVADTDSGQFYSSTNTPPASCRVGQTVNNGSGTVTLANSKGSVVVNLGTVSKAIAPGTTNSYGFVRFRVKVD